MSTGNVIHMLEGVQHRLEAIKDCEMCRPFISSPTKAETLSDSKEECYYCHYADARIKRDAVRIAELKEQLASSPPQQEQAESSLLSLPIVN